MAAADHRASRWGGLLAGASGKFRGKLFWLLPRNGFNSECDVWPASDGEPVVIHDATWSA